MDREHDCNITVLNKCITNISYQQTTNISGPHGNAMTWNDAAASALADDSNGDV